jgi:hypothetical protein
MQTTSMNDRIMPDTAPVSNYCFCFLIGAMNNRSILYIDLVADPDAVDIPSDHGIKPDAAMISDNHITKDRGIISYKTGCSQAGMIVIYW